MYTIFKMQKYKKVVNLQKIGGNFLANSQLFNTFAMKIYFIKTIEYGCTVDKRL